MRRDFKWGGRALAMAVLTMAVSLSERAQAQQTGLFPLAPIRRERPPCPSEDPVYKYYKQRYFGYHPTCWTPFPGGWGCPSKETVDKEEEFKKRPLGKPPEMAEEPANEPDQGQPPPRAGQPNRPLPEMPREEDPFLLDGPAALPPGRQTPRPAPRRDDPFTTIPQGAAVSPPRRGTQAGNGTQRPGEDAPLLSAPAGQPDQNTSARATGGNGIEAPVERGENGPLLAVEDLDAPRSSTGASAFDSQPIQPTVPATPSNANNQAVPPRRGLISNLFGGLGLNWLRR
jgi:hypothetical protein